MTIRRKKPLFGVDTMLFVYHFEQDRRFGVQAGKIFKAAEEDQCRLVTSVLSLMEVLVIPKRHGKKRLCKQYRDLFGLFPNLSVLPVDEDIAELASSLRAAHDIRTPDAIHLATALNASADAFISQDRRLQSIADIRILPLSKVPV